MNFSFSPWRSLKTRITILTLLIFLISIWSLAFYASRMLYKETKKMIGEQQFSTVSIVADQISEEIEERLNALEILSQKINPSLMNRPGELQATLEQHQIVQNLFNTGTFITGTDGTALASTPLSIGRSGASYIDRDYVLAALREGKTTVGRPVIGKHQKTPVFSMATPIFGSNGAVVGALVGVTNLSKPNFLDKITNNTYGKTGGYLLCAPQHSIIVTATDKKRIMQPTPAPGINPQFDKYSKGFEGYGHAVNSLGVEELTASKQIPAAGWFIIAKIPTVEAFAPINTMRQQVIIATLLLTLVAGGLVWFMLRRQIAPLISAANLLEAQPGTGFPAQLLPVTRQDEIGQLIGGFNRLLESVRQREQALLESEERYRSLFTGAGDGIFILSTDGRIVDINESLARMHGYTVQEMMNMDLRSLDTPETFQQAPERITRLFAGESLTFEVEHYHKDGHVFPLEVSASLFTFGGESYIQCFHRDISERKKVEEERIQLQQQFYHAQKLESLGVLTGGIAHDFNNILTVILGYCYVAREEPCTVEECREHFQKIEAAGCRASELCRQMLTYAGNSPMEQTTVNLRLLIEEVIRMLQAAIKENVAVTLELKRDIPGTLGDSGQIQQVVMNLIINAAEAIGDANGTITVSLTTVRLEPEQSDTDVFGTEIKAGRYVCLEVSDTGIGMDEQTQKRIFEPFYTTKFPGRGLGMSAIRGIVTAHGAYLHLTSTPGVGTSFKVCFPVIETPGCQVTLPSASALPAHTGGTVLLVEDEQTIQEMSEALLKTLGFTSVTRRNGLEALEAFRQHGDEIDLVLLDLVMPVMGGIDVYHELRRINPFLPVIICSGYSVESVEDIINSDQHAGFVHKPYKPDELRDAISRMIGEYKLHRP